MKVVLANTSGTGSLKYTAIWMDVTYGSCSGICPPQGANKFSSIEEMLPDYSGSYNSCTSKDGSPGDRETTASTFQNWITQRDCGTNGTKTGNTQYLSSSPVSPALPPGSENPPVRRFSLTSASQLGAGMRWFIKLAGGAGGDAYTHFLYDTWVYFPNDGSLNDAQVMEMDINHNSEDQQRLYLIGVQCNLHAGHWQVTKYGTGWIDTDKSCTRSQFTAGAWHHVQIKSRRDTTQDKIVYEQAAVDGVVVDFLCGGASCQSDWRPGSGFGAGTLGPNFQINAERNGAVVNIYTDTFAIYRW